MRKIQPANKNMAEDFLANVQEDGEKGEQAFSSDLSNQDGQVKETPAVPPADETTKVDKPSQGGVNTPDANVPFHKHPRWAKAQEELAELRKYRSETDTRLKTYEEVMSKFNQPAQSQVQIPDWFPKTGNAQEDGKKYQEYLNYENGVKAQIKQELVEEQTKEATQKAAEEKKWSDWVNTSLEKLEDDGNKFDRNELQKVALEYLPTDLEGNIDFGKALKIMNQLKQQQTAVQEVKSDARKRLADTASGSNSRGESAPKKFQTAQSLRNKSWDSLISE